jgi:Cu-Zn family superoxide dismutase
MIRTFALTLTCLITACTHLSDEQLPKMKEAPKIQTVQGQQGQIEMTVTARAHIEGLNGNGVSGQANFAVDKGVVTMDLVLTGLPEGAHAVHLHESGDCGALEATSEGEHWNPTNAKHGRFDTTPYHLGDVGNVFAGPDGRATFVFATEEWSVGTGLANDVVSHAVVVDAGKDDFRTQPDGASGRHLACGRIEISEGAPPSMSER